MRNRTSLPALRPFTYSKRGALQCEGVDVSALAAKYGTPLYVYSADQIRARIRLFRKHFGGRDMLLCYAVKANSNLSVLRVVAEEDGGFDVVSGGELERVLRVSKAGAERTVFSGVGKTAEEMDLALGAGILLFNVESEGELELLAERASRRRKKARFALRVNPDVPAGTHPYISTGLHEHKFGIDIQSARYVYRRALRMKWVEPVGVSAHIGSQIRTAEPFAAAMVRVAELVRELLVEGIAIRIVDAGGGLGIDYHVPLGGEDSAAGDVLNETVAAYAEAVTRGLQGLKVRLLLEPGRFLVAQAGALVTRVLYTKANREKRFVITDAGMNDLLRPALYGAHHEIVPVRRRAGSEHSAVDVVGPVCETGDFLARDREMDSAEPGDLLAVLDAGAYGMSLSSNYNTRPRAAEVLVQGKHAKLVRRRETVRDLLRTELSL